MSDSTSLVDWLTKIGVTRELNNSDILGGITVNVALSKVVPNYNVKLSATNTAVNRVNNWNTVIAELEKIGIAVTQQDKAKIIGGDDRTVYNILHSLKDYAQNSREEVEVNLSKIDVRGDPKSARSLLELFILVIVKYFGFSVKEAVALLSNDSKYLAHILAKGFKDDYRPVAGMLGQFLRLLPQINTFCKNKQNEIFFLKSIKPGLISKYLTVSEVTLQLITEFTKNNEGKYEIVKNELMATLVLCLKRHAVQLPAIIKSLTQILGYNKNMLILFMSNGSFSETVLLIMELLRQAQEEGEAQAIYELFKLEQFVQTCIENAKTSEQFINAASFLLKVAESNYSYFSRENENATKIVDNLSSLSLSKRSDVIIQSNMLFALLQLLARNKNSVAPQILRNIVDRYRSSYNEDESQNCLLNFLQTIQMFPSIPCSPMLQAIMARYQSATTFIGQLQLSIIQFSIPKIQEKLALRLYNLLTKIFVEQTGYSSIICSIIEAIISKFESSKIISDLTIKFVKVILAVYYANIRKLNYMKSLIDGTIKIDTNNAFYKIKNYQIQNILMSIISIKSQLLNRAIEPLICYSFLQVEAKNKEEAKGIKRIMLLLGDQQNFRKLYENDAKMLLQQAKNQTKGKADSRNKRMEIKQKTQRADTIAAKEVEAKNRVSSDASLLAKKKDLVVSSLNVKISSDVQKGLEKYTKAYIERMAKLSLQEQKKLAQEQRKEELRRKFTLKILQRGIKINKEESVNCIYEFNSKEKQQQQDTATDFAYLPFYNPDNEQERDIKALDFLIKKYSKVLKVYYNNYGGRLRPNAIKLFEDLSEKANLMQIANITKLLRDHQLDQYITGKQVQYVIQKINAHLKKQYKDSSLLDYEVFQQFIVQAALIMFSRPAKDMRSHPISDMFQLVIDKFRQHAAQNKIDQKIFDSSESIQTARPQQLKEINKKLTDNPDYILPEGYKKLTVKTVVFDHQFHLQSLELNFKDVYEALDQILFDRLGFHIIQPYSATIVQVSARPLLYQTQTNSEQPIKERSLSSIFPKSKQTRKQAEQAQQSAEQQANRDRLQNQYLRQKKIKEQQKQRKQQEEQKRREQRNKELKSLLQQHRSRQQQIQLKRQQERRIEAARQQEEKKKKERYQENLKKKVEEFLQKKKEEKIKEQEALKKKREQDAKNFERLKQDIERKKKMVEDSKAKKKQQEEQRIQRENNEKKKIEEYKKTKLNQKKQQNRILLEQYKEKKAKDKSGKSYTGLQEPLSPNKQVLTAIKGQGTDKLASKSNSKAQQ